MYALARCASGAGVILAFALQAWAAPPRVASTTPANGSKDVDPGTKEIKIRFDQAMSHGGYSLVGGGPRFPEIVGQPKWLGDRTLLVQVRLEPNHEYNLGINSPTFHNFTSAKGEAAVPLELSFRTGDQVNKATSQPDRKRRPKVIKSVPEDGAEKVDPATREITFTFDQPMDRSGFSIVGGGPDYPQSVGKPRWEDDRHLVMRVQLEPEHHYKLSVNSETFDNCKGANGEPAVPFPLTFDTGKAHGVGEGQQGDASQRESNGEAIVILRRAIEDDYSYRDLRKVSWEKQFARFDPELRDAQTPVAFAKVARRLLEPADDLHISIHAGDEVFYPRKSKVPDANFRLRILPRLVPQWTEHGKIVVTGQYHDGPAYVLVRSWDLDHENDLKAVYDLLAKADPGKGLLFDVRPNGGGDELMAQRVAGCFINSARVYAKDAHRSNGRFIGLFDRVVKPNAAEPHFAGRVAVLMGPRCVSSNESFLLMMKTVSGCRLIGARSRGASGSPKPVELPNGVTVYLPSWQDMLPNGTCFEGVGIAPDEDVPCQPDDFNQDDPVLSAALRFLSGPAPARAR